MDKSLVYTFFPEMREVAEFPGTVGEFFSRYEKIEPPANSFRQSLLIDAISLVAKKVFSEQQVNTIKKTLLERFMVSTAEHHASITHPEQLTVVLDQFLLQSKLKLPIIALSCNSVKLNNEIYPRGVIFNKQKLPFLPKKYSECLPLRVPPLSEECFLKAVNKAYRSALLSQDEYTNIVEWFKKEAFYAAKQDTFWKQISQLNYRLFKDIFQKIATENVEYFMLPGEEVITTLMRFDQRQQKPSWIYHMIFNSELREKLFSTFDGTPVTWCSKQKKGTFLFWWVTKEGKPERLFPDGAHFIDTQGNTKLPITEDAVLQHLEKGNLIPSSCLELLYLTFYCDIKVYGGLLQINYLAEMKEKLIKSMKNILSEEDTNIIQNVTTNYYVNYEESNCSAGGLQRAFTPITQDEFNRFKSQPQSESVLGCLTYLHDMAFFQQRN